ncbi:MAG: sugar ABC transporter permease [Candidatus Limiplasma sp.]|nr:sugar ABC transporter permease [Candidatus Limiplasma sp.]
MERLHHRRWDRDRVVATCVLIFPMLLFYILFIIKPVCTSIVYSLMKVDVVRGGVATQFLGLANFREILRDQVFLKAAGNTVIWAIVSPCLEIPMGLMLALALKSRLRGSGFFRAAWFAPVLLPQVVVGIIWAWIFNSEWGLLNQILSNAGLHSLTRAWLGKPDTALPALIFVTTWIWTGFNMILLLSAVSTVSEDVLEAARIDGASYWRSVFHVIIPIIRPVILNAMILCFIGKMKVYDLIYVTTKGGPAWATETVATYTVRRAFNWDVIERGYPSAMATLWFLLILIVSALANRAVRKSYLE